MRLLRRVTGREGVCVAIPQQRNDIVEESGVGFGGLTVWVIVS